MNLYESIKKNLTETDGRYYVLRKLQDAFDSLSEIDYGDQEDSPRYGNMEQGIIEQNIINEEIKNLVQDNNITKEEFDDVAKPYKDGFDISFSYYDYVPKHGKIEEADEGLYVYSNAQSQDGRSDAESYIHNYKAEAPNLDFKVRKDGGMWYVDFIGSKEDIASYLKKLGWYTDKEIEEYGLIEPLNETDELSAFRKIFRVNNTKMKTDGFKEAKLYLYHVILRDANKKYDAKSISREERNKIIDDAHDRLIKGKSNNVLNTVSDELVEKAYKSFVKNYPDERATKNLTLDLFKKLLNESDNKESGREDKFKDFLDIKKHTISELNSLIDVYLKQYPSETGISVASKNPKLPITKGDYNGWATICIGNHKNSGKVYVFEGNGDGSDDKEMSFEDFCKNYEFRLGREGE